MDKPISIRIPDQIKEKLELKRDELTGMFPVSVSFSKVLLMAVEKGLENWEGKPKKKTVAKPETDLQALCREIWAAYKDAYFNRYGTEPVRNAKINSQVKQLAQRIGNDGPVVAAFYVSINDQYLIKRVHDFGLLLNQCESYRTQCVTGNAVTTTRARELERTQSNFDAATEAKRLMQERNRG